MLKVIRVSEGGFLDLPHSDGSLPGRVVRTPCVRFDVTDYERRSGRLRWDDLDFDAFRDRPLDGDTLRAIEYMHDVESHTICYLRDLLVTSAHVDSDVTDFPQLWGYEELWHGGALGAVLTAHSASSPCT